MKKIKCPRCQKPTTFSPDNLYRPFCSERCQTIDLGNWAEQKYSIHSTDEDDKSSPSETPAGSADWKEKH